jgi:hypothetical protein
VHVLARGSAAVEGGKLKATGPKPKRTSIQSPWQNGIAERWVGSCRRELLDQVIPLNEAHRLMVNRSVTWADWDEDLLSLELQEIQAANFDVSLTGFDGDELLRLLEPKGTAPPRNLTGNFFPKIRQKAMSKTKDSMPLVLAKNIVYRKAGHAD